MGFFSRKPKLDGGNIGFDENLNPFKIAYTAIPLPDPGAMNHVIESLSLPKIQPIGPAEMVQHPFRATNGEQMYYNQGQYLSGMPGQVTGGLRLQPLFDPTIGFVGAPETEAPLNVDL